MKVHQVGPRRYCVALESIDYVDGRVDPQNILAFAREHKIIDTQPNNGSMIWILYPDYTTASAYAITWIGMCINLGVKFGFEGPLYHEHASYAA
jgi:hypothetical protein